MLDVLMGIALVLAIMWMLMNLFSAFVVIVEDTSWFIHLCWSIRRWQHRREKE